MQVIGQGQYGTVYRDGLEAVKRMKSKIGSCYDGRQEYRNTVEAHARVPAYIARPVSLEVQGGHYVMRTEFVPGHTLEWFQEISANTFDRVFHMFRALISARVLNHDTKASNIILAHDGRVVQIDWGLARVNGIRSGNMRAHFVECAMVLYYQSENIGTTEIYSTAPHANTATKRAFFAALRPHLRSGDWRGAFRDGNPYAQSGVEFACEAKAKTFIDYAISQRPNC